MLSPVGLQVFALPVTDQPSKLGLSAGSEGDIASFRACAVLGWSFCAQDGCGKIRNLAACRTWRCPFREAEHGALLTHINTSAVAVAAQLMLD